MARDTCPLCGSTDVERVQAEQRSGRGLDESPAKEYAFCRGCEVYLIRPTGTDEPWRRRMNCRGSAADVAAQLNSLSMSHTGYADVKLCNNGCFNLEGVVIESGESVLSREAEPGREWFKVDFGLAYTADDILQRFPDAWRDCPGLGR